jgi:hypothetical protein
MSKFRRAAKIDANQSEIVKDLRKIGYSVELNHDDILVGHAGKTYWFELKTGPKAAVKESQKKLLENWTGHYSIVWTTEMIIKEIRSAQNNVRPSD